MINSMVKNKYNDATLCYEEKLFSLFTTEIDFLNHLEEKAENIYQKYMIQNMLFKLENLLHILLESSIPIESEDYQSILNFIYHTIKIIIKIITN